MKERKEKKGEEKGKEIVKGRKRGGKREKVNHQPGGPTKKEWEMKRQMRWEIN